MPSVYTEKLFHGEEVSFAELVLDCARPFVIHDYESNEPLPERFQPEPFYAEQLQAAWKRLIEVRLWSAEAAEREAQAAYDKELSEYEEARVKRRTVVERYLSRLDEAEAWVPPTDSHQALKEYVIEQLRSGIDEMGGGDEADQKPPKLRKLSGQYFKRRELAEARRNVGHWEERLKDAKREAKHRTAYVRQLRKSLEEQPAEAVTA